MNEKVAYGWRDGTVDERMEEYMDILKSSQNYGWMQYLKKEDRNSLEKSG